MVCISVLQKMTEPIEMPLGGDSEPNEPLLDWGTNVCHLMNMTE